MDDPTLPVAVLRLKYQGLDAGDREHFDYWFDLALEDSPSPAAAQFAWWVVENCLPLVPSRGDWDPPQGREGLFE